MSVPLFKSHHSIGKSILTIDEYEENASKTSSRSIIQIAKENNLHEIFLIEDNMSGFIPAYQNCNKINIKLIYGIRFIIINDRDKKEEIPTEHKIVVLIKNNQGYKDLIKLYTYFHTKFNDYKALNEFWTDNLILAIPFYDSFIYNNLLTISNCIPQFPSKPFIFLEDNHLPFDSLVRRRATIFAKNENLETVEAKTIYYENREDFEAWQTFKLMNRRSHGSGNTLESPNLSHCGSCEFCFESYLERIK